MRRFVTPAVLALSGVMAVVIGFSILFNPQAFFAQNGVALGDDPNLLSEIRAPGGLLLGAGFIILAGAAMQWLRRTALVTAMVVFGTYGLARLVSIALDGAPSSSLMGALAVELIVAAYAAFVLAGRTRTRCGASRGCRAAAS